MKKSSKIFIISLIVLISIVISFLIFSNNTNSFNENEQLYGFTKALDVAYPLTQDELKELSPYNEEKEKKLSLLPPYNDNDTWDIYIYMCGSDLESSFNDSLSEITSLNLALYQNENNANYKEIEKIKEIRNVLYENSLDFPSPFYDSVASFPIDEMDEYSEEMKGSASEDLRAITSTPIKSNIRFIIQTGGAKKWDFPGINPNRCQRFIYDSIGFREIYNGNIENMGSKEGMESFLSFIQDYEADHKMFIFWDHGEGAFGAEHDELFSDKLYLSEIRDAFSNFYNLDNRPPFELLGFDACLMGNIEACSYLKGIAKYYVASEDIEFGGWNYSEWISSLNENPAMNGALLGKEIVDSYIKIATQQYLLSGEEVPNTLSVYDLSKASIIYDKYAYLMDKILKDVTKDINVLSKVTKASKDSIRYASQDYETFNTCDLTLFMNNLKPMYEKETNEIINLIDEATLYTRGRGHNKYSSGLSIYFPTTIKDLSSLIQCMDYIDNVTSSLSIKTLYFYKAMGCLNKEYKDYIAFHHLSPLLPLDSSNLQNIKNSDITIKEECILLKLDTKYVNNASLIKAKYEEDKITYLTETPCIIEENLITIPLNTIQTALYLEDEELSMEHMFNINDISRYKSEVLLNGKPCSIIIDYNLSNKCLVISGIKDESLPSDTVGRSLRTINKGDKITPLYYTESGFYLEEKYEKGKRIKYDTHSLEIKDSKNGSYLLCVELSDLRGNVYTSPVIEVRIQNGKVMDAFINESVQTF